MVQREFESGTLYSCGLRRQAAHRHREPSSCRVRRPCHGTGRSCGTPLLAKTITRPSGLHVNADKVGHRIHTLGYRPCDDNSETKDESSQLMATNFRGQHRNMVLASDQTLDVAGKKTSTLKSPLREGGLQDEAGITQCGLCGRYGYTLPVSSFAWQRGIFHAGDNVNLPYRET